MKKIIVIIVILLANYVAKAQFQIFDKITKEKSPNYDINYYSSKSISDSGKIGIWGFTLVEQGWAEAYGGLSYSPTKWFSIAAGIGIEQNPALYRLGGSVYFGNNKITSLTCWEKGDGKNNWWYKSILKYNLKNFDLGLLSWRYYPTGLYLAYKPNKIITVWINPGRDLEFGQNQVVVGLDFKLN